MKKSTALKLVATAKAQARGPAARRAPQAQPKPKRQVDPERTRQKLLEAARFEFASKGLKGARISSIAKRAGTNYQAIYHHFGNKEKIYLAVLDHLFSDDWSAEARVKVDSMPPLEAMTYFLMFLADKYRTDPAYGAILLDENIHRAKHLKALPVARNFYLRLVSTLDSILVRGKAVGLFRSDIDALDLYFTAAGSLSLPIISKFTISEGFGRDIKTEEAVRLWSIRTIDFLLHGLKAS